MLFSYQAEYREGRQWCSLINRLSLTEIKKPKQKGAAVPR